MHHPIRPISTRESRSQPRPRRRRLTGVLLLSPLLVLAVSCGPEEEARGPVSVRLAVIEQTSGTDALLQAVSAVSDSVAWVAGHGGTWGVTLDGGGSWSVSAMSGADSLEFRDVDAFDGRDAYLMSSGPGELSRIYRTEDGGRSWTLQYTADHPDAFLDCMDFWDRDRGLAYGDAVDGELFVLRTEDGGRTWNRLPPDSLPDAQEGEGGFAASGSCVFTGGQDMAWIATGNGPEARVLRTSDGGETWDASTVPVTLGESAGLTTVDFLNPEVGFAMGGAMHADTVRAPAVAVTVDGGATWSRGGLLAMSGPVYGGSFVPEMPAPTFFAVGPGGVSWSPDLGRSWRPVNDTPHWAVAFASNSAGWAVGPGGRITRLAFVQEEAP